MGKTKMAIKKGVLAIVLLAATTALAGVLARFLSDSFTTLQQVYLRVFIALLIALVVFRAYLRWRTIARLPLKEWAVIAFRGLTAYAVGVVLMTQAVTMTSLAEVTFIAALPFAPLLGFMLLKERLTWWKLAFIFGSLFGVAMLATNNPANLLSWQPGDLIAVVATLGLALSYVARKWHSGVLNNQEITTLTFVVGAGSVFLLSMLFGEGAPPMDISWLFWLGILGGGVLNVGKLFLTNYGFQKVDAVQGGNILTLEGAWGLLFGLLFYSEWPTWQGLLGGIIIVTCVIGMNIFSRRSKTNVAAPPEGHIKL